MRSIQKKIKEIFRIRPALVFIFLGIVFVISITMLFAWEKRKLDAEFEGMISDSLNIHTKSNAQEINHIITDAEHAIKIARAMLRRSDANGSIKERLERRNANAPVYPTEYLAMEEITADSLYTEKGDILKQLEEGETVVNIVYDKADEEYCLLVIVPMMDESSMTGALYTRLKAEKLFPHIFESAVYQDVASSIVSKDGEVLFSTYDFEYNDNIFTNLRQSGLTEEEVARIDAVINSPEMDGTTFLRKEQTYFASAESLEHNGWYIVTFVRGPDVLLRSTGIFKDVVNTSVISIIITATAACIIFLRLLFNKKELEKEQQRNQRLVQRLQAMFEQHSALKVVLDMETKKIVDANPALCSYFGADKQALLGRSMKEFNLLPDHVLDEQIRDTSSGKALFFAAPHRIRNGEIRFLDVYASKIYDGGRSLIYAILFDSTDREQYRNELLREKEFLKTTLQSIGDGVVTTDNLGIITSMNSVAEKLTGWYDGAAVGKSFTEVFILQNEETRQTVENPIQKVLETGYIVGLANHTELVNRQGVRVPIADSAAPIKSADGQTFGVVMVFRDVRDEKEHHKQIEYLSYHDYLTGLYNRRYIEETINRLDEEKHVPVSVIMADVNGLKITNDVFGHRAGDELLKNTAELMRRNCKEKDLIARWGGDEFVILMPDTSLEEAEETAANIKDTNIVIEGVKLSVSLSIGSACKNIAGDSIQIAMQQAEKYMYHQKLLDGKSFRNAIISTLLATLYEKSNETEEHSKRMEKHCHDIGRRLQLSSKEMDELSLLALLHDIGKVSINPNILQKPGPLTNTEWDEMKRHPEIGYRIAQATPELAVVSELILSHHERWDGKGYPRGLKGTAIPLSCRILAVADAYDAMTNDRVYRSAMSGEEAVKELEKNAGTQFEAGIVRFFIDSLKSED